MEPEQERGKREGAEVIPIAPDLTTRVGAILESVQREAERILEQARVEAESRTPAVEVQAETVRRRLLALADELADRAEGILAAASGDEVAELGASFGRLAQALTRAADALAHDVEIALGERPAETVAGQRVHRAAVEMAALGCTRAQVESHLSDYLGVADPVAVLDRIFGRTGGPDARVDWALPPEG